MTQVSFNAKALGIASNDSCRDERHALAGGPHEAIVVIRPGIEAIREGLRLADIKCFNASEGHQPTGHIDP